MKRPLFDQVTIVGLGLIGGSLGMALKKRRVARKIYGVDLTAARLHAARSRGAIDEGSARLSDGLLRTELVIIAVPPTAVPVVVRQIARFTRRPLTVTDVASTKGEIVRAVQKILPPQISFIGGHPMAGSERSGIGAANADLFRESICILTPTPRTKDRALSQVNALWRSVGSHVLFLDPTRHDALVAQVSHVPHLAAVGLTLAVGSGGLKIAARGFADTTRIALSDPALWEEVCTTNRRQIISALDRFLKEIERLKTLVARRKSGLLRRRFEAAQRKRRQVCR